MENKFEEGERILIILNTGENFEGDYVKGSNTRIEIENFTHYETGNKFESKMTFYKGEINSVLRISGKKTESVPDKTPSKKTDDKILIPRDEYERLKIMTDEFILIKTDDKSYYDCIEKLSNYDSLGVIASNCEKGRFGRIKVLALSSWKQTYIFDFHNFRTKHFPKELMEILQSPYIQKVVFNGGPLVDCLFHAYKIRVNNIYDIQISHLLLMKNSNGKCEEELPTIGHCLTNYFNFSPSFLKSALEILTDSWDVRPVDVDKLKKISRLVAYLILLRDHQTSLMLKEYNKSVQDYHDLFLKTNGFHLMEMIVNKKCTKQINDLIPNSLLSPNSIKSVKYE